MHRTLWRSALAAVLALTAAPVGASAKALRIASWNIANLSVAGDALRGQLRTQADIEAVRTILHGLDADVIALQEVGSLPAARAVLGDGYEVAIEARCERNATRCQGNAGDIYTGIAWRKTLGTAVETFQIAELATSHTDECGVTRQLRGGVGIKLVIKGRPTWIPSLHLKASCKSGKPARGQGEQDCASHARQLQALRQWMNGLPAGDAVILAGDFNHHLLKPALAQALAPPIDSGRQQTILPGGNRFCWSRRDTGINLGEERWKREALAANPDFDRNGAVPYLYDPWASRDIDFFVVENAADWALKGRQVPMRGHYQLRNIGHATLKTCDGKPKTFRNAIDPRDGQKKPAAMAFSESYPSDHCPIVLDIE